MNDNTANHSRVMAFDRLIWLAVPIPVTGTVRVRPIDRPTSQD